MLKPTGYRDAAGVTYSVFWRHTLCHYAGDNGPGERKSFTLESEEMYGNQKKYKERSAAKKKSVSSTSGKKRGRKKSGKRSPGIISGAKKVVGEVLTGAVAGAASGAVIGAAEAGTKAAVGEPTKKTSKGKNTSAKQSERRR